jgi:hypothetical protein
MDGRYDNQLAEKLPFAFHSSGNMSYAAFSVCISRPGGFPKKRLYSRLNWPGLFVADIEACTRSIEFICEHLLPCRLQPVGRLPSHRGCRSCLETVPLEDCWLLLFLNERVEHCGPLAFEISVLLETQPKQSFDSLQRLRPG